MPPKINERLIIRGKLFPGFGVDFRLPMKIESFLDTIDLYILSEIIIFKDDITISCELNKLNYDTHIRQILSVMKEHCDLYANAIFLKTGNVTQPLFETAQLSDGSIKPLTFTFMPIKKCVTSFDLTLESVLSFVQVMHGDRRRLKALRDLVETLNDQTNILINCGRTVDLIRNCVSPAGLKTNDSWAFMREHLNISKDLLTNITSQSAKPRHGENDFVKDVITTQLILDTAMCFDRMVHYFLRGGEKPLSNIEFPVLQLPESI